MNFSGGLGGGRSPPQCGEAAIGGSGGGAPRTSGGFWGGEAPPTGPGPGPMGPMVPWYQQTGVPKMDSPGRGACFRTQKLVSPTNGGVQKWIPPAGASAFGHKNLYWVTSCGNWVMSCGNWVTSCGNWVTSCGNWVTSCFNRVTSCGNWAPSCGNICIDKLPINRPNGRYVS